MQRFSHTPPRYPTRRPEVLAAANRVLSEADGWVRLEGEPELEADLAAFHGPDRQGRAAIPWFISSGTAALEAIMLGHGIGPGDEVITSPWTWGATVSAVLAIGAVPVFCDIDPVSARMRPELVPELISERTKAVLVVHLFGHPVDCAAFRSVCDEHGLLLFEDGSQAHCARYDGVKVGDWGDAAAFSCMGLKLLAGTEGGFAIFRDPAAAEAAYLHGKHPRGLEPEQAQRLGDAGLLDALQLGWRPCTISAAMIKAALPFLESEVEGRRSNAAVLREALAGQDRVVLPEELPAAAGCYHLLSLWCAGDRDAFIAKLVEAGLEPFIYIPTPLHRLARMAIGDYSGPRTFWHDQLKRAGVDYAAVSLPGAEERSRRTVELGFNWTEPNPEAMKDLGAILVEAAG